MTDNDQDILDAYAGRIMRGNLVSGTDLLGVLFVGLKLASIITWSWWLVLLPFIYEFGIAITLSGIVKFIRRQNKGE